MTVSSADDPTEPILDSALLSAALKGVRQERGLSARAVGAAMNMSPRTYYRFEAGETRPNLEHIHRFAIATKSDGHAIIAAILIGDPAFARRSAENQFATVVTAGLQSFNAQQGDRIRALDTRTLVEAVAGMFQQLTEAIESAEAAKAWVREGQQALSFARPKPGR